MEPLPSQATAALTAAAEPLEPCPFSVPEDLAQASAVAVHSKISKVTADSPDERSVLFFER
jgi:hypothetical protein